MVTLNLRFIQPESSGVICGVRYLCINFGWFKKERKWLNMEVILRKRSFYFQRSFTLAYRQAFLSASFFLWKCFQSRTVLSPAVIVSLWQNKSTISFLYVSDERLVILKKRQDMFSPIRNLSPAQMTLSHHSSLGSFFLKWTWLLHLCYNA